MLRASLVHDYEYRLRDGVRRLADERFRRVLLEDGVPADAAALMFYAVRIGGRVHWQDAEDRAAAAVEWPIDDLL